MKRCIALAVAILLCPAAAFADESWGVQQRSLSWDTNPTDHAPRAGIDSGCFTRMTLKPGAPSGVTVAFWSDDGSFRGTATAYKSQATYEGEHTGGKEPTEIRVATEDGKRANVRIGKSVFEVSADTLFLISSSRRDVQKLTLPAQKSGSTAGTIEMLAGWADADSKIRSFWSGDAPRDQDANTE